MRTGNLFIVSGPSGAGKGTLVRELVGRVADAWVSVSVTTRAPRPAEVEGRHYFFASNEEVHGNRYGTPREAVEAQVAAGKQVILEIDPQGAFQVKSLVGDSVLVFVMPPSWEELQRRLEGRGSESRTQVETRLETAKRELELVGEYDHVVINDDVSRATDELAAIVDSYANRPEA
jgi:guanylate kinase